MTRKKVKVAWIANDAARRASLKKRRVGLLKKVSELTVLCGVDAFCIIYSPDESEPVVWPSPSTVRQLILRFRDLPEIERYKKAMNQETYLKERIGKAKDQSKKHQKKNKDLDLSWYVQQVHEGRDLNDFDVGELHCFSWLLIERIYEYRKRRDYFQNVPSLPTVPVIPQQVHNVEAIGIAGGVVSGGDGGGGDDASGAPYLWNQWFYDTMMKNIENAGGGGDMGAPYGFNMSNYGSNFCQMDMGNFYQGNTDENLTCEANSSQGNPRGNFYQEGGNSGAGVNLEQPYVGVGRINSGGEMIGSGIPHGTMEGSLGGLSMMGLLNSNLGGCYNVGNAAVPYGNWEGANEGRNFPAMQGSYNNQMRVGNNKGKILGRLGLPNMAMDGLGNDQMVGLPGGNIHGHGNDHHQMGIGQPRGNFVEGFGNAMEVDAVDERDPNSNVVKGHENELVSGLPNENIVRDQNDEGNDDVEDWNSTVGDCGGSDAGSDVGFQSGFFGAASDMGLPFDVSKTWPNSPSP